MVSPRMNIPADLQIFPMSEFCDSGQGPLLPLEEHSAQAEPTNLPSHLS